MPCIFLFIYLLGQRSRRLCLVYREWGTLRLPTMVRPTELISRSEAYMGVIVVDSNVTDFAHITK